MILEKFLGNFLKKVTTVGESGEIPHSCYLGRFPWDKSLKEYRRESENATLQMAGNLKIHLLTDKGRDW